MKTVEQFEFPYFLKDDYKKAIHLEWLTILYLISTASLVFLSMNSSQSMKTALFEDLISMTPAISFLIASRFINKYPDRRFPYGYHRVVSIAYLVSSTALLGVGIFLLSDSAITLIEEKKITLGYFDLFGEKVWKGYLMIVVMVYGIIPALILGRFKLPLAKRIHDKNLYADAKMNKADWMTATGTILGIIGLGIGWWWADALAACLISLDIIHDGYKNLKQSVLDLMDEIPKTVGGKEVDPIIEKIQNVLNSENWVNKSEIRLREEGHIYVGQGFVIPKSEDHLIDHLESLTQKVRALDWRLHDFTVTPVHNFDKLSHNLH